MRIKVFNFQTLFFVVLFIVTAFVMLNSTSYSDKKFELTFLCLAFFLIFVQYNSLNFNMPESMAFLLNAGFKKWEIIFLFGGTYLILSFILLLFIFPIKNLADAVFFLLFFSYAILIEVSWLVFGSSSVILLMLVPMVANFILTLFFTLILHWDFGDIVSHSIIIQGSMIAVILSANLFLYNRFFKGDLT